MNAIDGTDRNVAVSTGKKKALLVLGEIRLSDIALPTGC